MIAAQATFRLGTWTSEELALSTIEQIRGNVVMISHRLAKFYVEGLGKKLELKT